MRYLFFIAVIFGLILEGVLSQDPNQKYVLDECGKQVSVKGKKERRAIEVTPGKALVIKLRASPGSGYAWIVDGDYPDVIDAEWKTYFETENTNNEDSKVGQNECQVLEFTAKKSGKGKLVLTYRRPWEKPDDYLRRIEVTVVVTGERSGVR